MGMIEKDIKAAVLAFKADDFQLLNVLGNRIMSDSLFIPNPLLAVSGFFVKQVALTYLNLKPQLSDSEFLDAKILGEKYVNALSEASDKANQQQLWADYHQFNLDLRKFPTTGINKQIAEVYGEDSDVTQRVRKWLIDFLNANKALLFDGRNNFIKGVLTELQRVGFAFGYQVTDTIIYSCLLALDRYYDYFKFQHAVEGQVDNEAVKTQIFPYLERIKALSSSNPLDTKMAEELLWDLIRGWREFFIFYLELSPRMPSQQVELSKETKTKLSEVLGKALQRELKT